MQEKYKDNDKSALISLTKKEQEFRHQQQTKQQKINNVSYFLGLILGFIYNVFLLNKVYLLVQNNNAGLAFALFFINAILILVSFVVLSLSRKPKKPHNKKPRR